MTVQTLVTAVLGELAKLGIGQTEITIFIVGFIVGALLTHGGHRAYGYYRRRYRGYY